MEKHFTASVYIIEENKVLLLYHRKLGKWLQPGGHLEGNETPPECAKREALEETGLEIEFLKQENLWLNSWNSNSFERPFLCLLENIPSHGTSPAHQHIDFIYVARPLPGKLLAKEDEVERLHWFSWEEIAALNADTEIYKETQQTIKQLLFNTVFDLATSLKMTQ